MKNEKRLIDAVDMKNNIMEAMMRTFEKNGDKTALRIAELMWHFIDVTDLVDAVEVVRCKNCAFFRPGNVYPSCMNWGRNTDNNGWCYMGERKDND